MTTTAELATQVIKATQALQLAGIQKNCNHRFKKNVCVYCKLDGSF